MARDLLPYAVLFILLLIAVYIYTMAIRSREAELKQALRRTEIALQDAERSLQNAADFHAGEIRRMRTKRADSSTDDWSQTKFRDARNAFARLFHPDMAHGGAKEREIRTAMFQQYWAELERIERDE
jgi:type II secretory pathway pseudopilin PulG